MNDTSKMDKEYLTAQVTAFQNGDESSFSNIYQMISDKLLTHAVFMTKDRMEAEDLLQETMIRIITSIGTLRDPAAFTAWSIQIMRHVYWHKQRRNTEVVARDDSDLSVFENLVDEDDSYRPDIAAEDASIGELVKAEMDKLPESQRTAMIAYYYDGLSVSEISEMMGATENTTKSRLFAGRKAMKKGIEKYEQKTGTRIHEFVPASIIAELVRSIFTVAGIAKEEVLKAIFRTAIEVTGISAALPADPVDIDTPEPDMEPAPDDAADISELETEASPDDIADVQEPGAESVPEADEMPDITEPETETAPAPDNTADIQEPDIEAAPEADEMPDIPEPEPELSPEETPDASEAESYQPQDRTQPDHISDKASNTGIAENEHITHLAAQAERSRTLNNYADNKKTAESAARAAQLNRRAKLLKILAVIAGALAIAGISLKVAFPDLLSSLAGPDVSVDEYSKAYLSVLALYEDDINDYNWQFSDYAGSERQDEGKPVALKDIDGDGVPELFLMAAAVADEDNNWYCADLHIFTYKSGGLRELEYEFDYPNEYTPEYYDNWAGYYVDHDGRLVHFSTMEPNTSYAVFTGGTEGSLYILGRNMGSETADFRLRKYSMESDDERSRLSLVSDTFEIDTIYDTLTSDDPDAELEAAINDMDEIVIYGGYGANLGLASDAPFDDVHDAEKNGWQSIHITGDDSGADIAPEIFQSGLSMTYDECVVLLQDLIDKNKDDKSNSSAEWIPLTTDGNMCRAGCRLFKYDIDTYELKCVKIGESEVRTLSRDIYGGIGYPYSDGDSILYLDYSGYGSFDDAYPVPLVRYDIDSESGETLHEFMGTPDPNAAYYIGTVYEGAAFVGFSEGDGETLWTCDLESGETAELKDHVFIRERSGDYVIATDQNGLSAYDTWQADIYQLSDSGLNHVKGLGSNISVCMDTVNGKFCYASCTDKNARDVTLYRCNSDGSDEETLAHFTSENDNSILVEKFAEAYCLVRLDGTLYKYFYDTGETITIE